MTETATECPDLLTMIGQFRLAAYFVDFVRNGRPRCVGAVLRLIRPRGEDLAREAEKSHQDPLVSMEAFILPRSRALSVVPRPTSGPHFLS